MSQVERVHRLVTQHKVKYFQRRKTCMDARSRPTTSCWRRTTLWRSVTTGPWPTKPYIVKFKETSSGREAIEKPSGNKRFPVHFVSPNVHQRPTSVHLPMHQFNINKSWRSILLQFNFFCRKWTKNATCCALITQNSELLSSSALIG